jgi:hypothetical protein
VTGAPAILHTVTDLVAVAWIRTIQGLTADGVATQPPDDQTTWAANGFIAVPVSVGGTPHSTTPLRRPVCQVDCLATVPGSDRIPWGIANQLAEQVRMGTMDRRHFGRPLTITAGGLTLPTATVKGATMLTEPRRIWSDVGNYGGFSFDLRLDWTAQGEVIF